MGVQRYTQPPSKRPQQTVISLGSCDALPYTFPFLNAIVLLPLSRSQEVSSATTPPTPLPTPTARPLPPIAPLPRTFLFELSTALFYVFLIANGGDAQGLCDAINPPALDAIGAVDGTAIKREICAAASIEASNSTLGA